CGLRRDRSGAVRRPRLPGVRQRDTKIHARSHVGRCTALLRRGVEGARRAPQREVDRTSARERAASAGRAGGGAGWDSARARGSRAWLPAGRGVRRPARWPLIPTAGARCGAPCRPDRDGPGPHRLLDDADPRWIRRRPDTVRSALHHVRPRAERDGGAICGDNSNRGAVARRTSRMKSSWQPRTLILQHEAATPPGLMATWLHEQSARVETLRIDEDERPLDARDYDLIVSLGSEFAAFDDSVPFVPREARFFEQASESDVPILGLCFGGQMLARVLGAK